MEVEEKGQCSSVRTVEKSLREREIERERERVTS